MLPSIPHAAHVARFVQLEARGKQSDRTHRTKHFSVCGEKATEKGWKKVKCLSVGKQTPPRSRRSGGLFTSSSGVSISSQPRSHGAIFRFISASIGWPRILRDIGPAVCSQCIDIFGRGNWPGKTVARDHEWRHFMAVAGLPSNCRAGLSSL